MEIEKREVGSGSGSGQYQTGSETLIIRDKEMGRNNLGVRAKIAQGGGAKIFAHNQIISDFAHLVVF